MARWLRYLSPYRSIKKSVEIAAEAAWWSYHFVDAIYQSPDTNAAWWRPPPKGSRRERNERILGRILPPLIAAYVGLSVLYILVCIEAWMTSNNLLLLQLIGDLLVWQLHTLLGT